VLDNLPEVVGTDMVWETVREHSDYETDSAVAGGAYHIRKPHSLVTSLG